MQLSKDKVEQELTNLLNDCLESNNQEYSFEVTDINLETMKFSVDFNIVVIEEDNYIGFQGY